MISYRDSFKYLTPHPQIIRFIFNGLLFLFLLYLTLASVTSLFLEPQTPDWAFIYYFISLSIALPFSWYGLPKMQSITPIIKKNPLTSFALAIFLFVSLGALVIQRYQWIDYNSVWFDEAYQHTPAKLDIEHPNLVRLASVQQQPPIDYFLSNYSLHFFPHTPTGLRFHATLFSSLATLLFFILTLSKTRSWFLATFGTFLLNFNPLLFFYATEARPQSVAFFTLCLFLFFLAEFLQKNNQRNRHMLILSGTIWSWTIGLQPLIIGFLLLLSLSIENFIIGSRKQAKNLLNIGLTIFIIHGPLLFASIIESYQADKFYVSPIYRIVETFKTLGWETLTHYASAWGSTLGYERPIVQILFFPLVIALFFFLRFIASKHYTLRKVTPPSGISFLFFHFMFPFTFEIVFKSFVHWPFFAKYYVLYIVVCLFLFLSAISWSQRSQPFFIHIFVVCILTTFLVRYGPNYLKQHTYEITQRSSYRPDLKKLTEEIKHWSGHTLIQHIPTFPMGLNVAPPTMEVDYYQENKANSQFQFSGQGFQQMWEKEFKYLLIWKPQFSLGNLNIQNRVLLFTKFGYHSVEKMNEFPKTKKALQHPGFEKVVNGQGFVLVKLTSHYFHKYTIKDLTYQIIEMLPEELSESKFPFLAYLAETAIQKKEKQKALYYIKKLKELKRGNDNHFGQFKQRSTAWQRMPNYIKYLEDKIEKNERY